MLIWALPRSANANLCTSSPLRRPAFRCFAFGLMCWYMPFIALHRSARLCLSYAIHFHASPIRCRAHHSGAAPLPCGAGHCRCITQTCYAFAVMGYPCLSFAAVWVALPLPFSAIALLAISLHCRCHAIYSKAVPTRIIAEHCLCYAKLYTTSA